MTCPKDCPWQGDEQVHVPWCRDIPGKLMKGRYHAYVATHQHKPKKGMGGNNPDSRIVAILCLLCHDYIDNYPYWNDSVVDGEYLVYNDQGERLLRRQIPEAVNGRRADGLAPDRDSGDSSGSGGSDRELVVAAVGARADDSGGVASGLLVVPEYWPREQQARYRDWAARGLTLKEKIRNIPWEIGDWLVEGESYGEEASQYVEELGVSMPSLRQYVICSKAFPDGERRSGVAWSIHRALAYADLDPETRQKWLSVAETEHLTASAFGKLLKGDSTQVREECPTCHRPL